MVMAPGDFERAEPAESAREVLLSVRDLTVARTLAGKQLTILNNVSVDIGVQESVALVGESGSGKTMTALAILRLLPEGMQALGRISFGEYEMMELSEKALSRIRGRKVAMIYQDARSSFNPAYTVGEQIAETMRRHLGVSRREARSRAVEFLDLVGIPDARRRVEDYPHVFSGGMLQRAGIAMALCCGPELLLADEPTTALDTTVQAQILDLLDSLRQEFGMSLLLMTHDLGVVASVCDRVFVMYAGQVVESGEIDMLFNDAMHPYTDGLLRSVITLDHDNDDPFWIPGVVSSPGARPTGCSFHPRCVHCQQGLCDVDPPSLKQHGNRLVSCWRAHELQLGLREEHASNR
jgi:peptide/nickel transport system ATP-binding protein